MMAYKATMKLADVVSSDQEKSSPSSIVKPKPVIVIEKPFKSKGNTLWPDTLESIKTSYDKDTPDTIFKTPIIKK